MKMCLPHWNKLKAAIKAKGLWQFVPTSGEEAAKRIESNTFEPLMGAYLAIWSIAVNATLLEVLTNDESGNERCPICFCMKEEWIESAAEGQLHIAIDRGLVFNQN